MSKALLIKSVNYKIQELGRTLLGPLLRSSGGSGALALPLSTLFWVGVVSSLASDSESVAIPVLRLRGSLGTGGMGFSVGDLSVGERIR